MLAYGNILWILSLKLNYYLIIMISKYIDNRKKEKHMKRDDILNIGIVLVSIRS